jgi:hypothetical protein
MSVPFNLDHNETYSPMSSEALFFILKPDNPKFAMGSWGFFVFFTHSETMAS